MKKIYSIEPCPFCGEIPNLVESSLGDKYKYYIKCNNSNCNMMISTKVYSTDELVSSEDLKNKVINIWNKRY